MAIRVITEKCVGCKLCIPTCAQGAISFVDKKAVIDVIKCNYCGACIDACKKFKAILIEIDRKVSDQDLSLYKGIWVYAEQRNGEMASVVYELLGEGRKLAEQLGEELSAVLLGDGVTCQAEDLIQHGADNVYVVDNPKLKDFQDDTYAMAMAELCEEYKPNIVLTGATAIGPTGCARPGGRRGLDLRSDAGGNIKVQGTSGAAGGAPAHCGVPRGWRAAAKRYSRRITIEVVKVM